MKRFSNVGGGGILKLFNQVCRSCKNKAICYNGDVGCHNYKEALEMKKGFTLAEVLVTLGIIGVVSAMTVPTLMQNYQRKSYVTQLHKVYNELQQALLQYQTDRNALNYREAGLNSIDAIRNFVTSYFKVVNDCGTDIDPCFARDYKDLQGSETKNLFESNTIYKYVLANGAAITVEAPDTNGNFTVHVDINSTNGPNIMGRDLFALKIYNNGIIDDSDSSGTLTAPLSNEKREELFQSLCNTAGGDWWGCFGKILNDNWEMTY